MRANKLGGSAKISRDGQYRYLLTRRWRRDYMPLVWIMLNPSVADAKTDDATIRRCIGFAKRLNYPAIHVVNLFAYRATSPSDLFRCENPVGAGNDGYIIEAVRKAGSVVCAWGAHGGYKDRDREVMALLKKLGVPPACLGETADGFPKHPLRLPYALTWQPYTRRR